jgi:hypothetical protein
MGTTYKLTAGKVTADDGAGDKPIGTLPSKGTVSLHIESDGAWRMDGGKAEDLSEETMRSFLSSVWKNRKEKGLAT